MDGGSAETEEALEEEQDEEGLGLRVYSFHFRDPSVFY